MKRKSILMLLGVAMCFFAHAKILRVGYPGAPLSGVDYAYNQFPNAITAAAAGDTIQLYQHYWAGGNSSGRITKKLTFIGFGYMLDKNPGLQAVKNAPNGTTLTFSTGSEGSTVQGVSGNFYVGASNINISRCYGDFLLGYDNHVGPVQGLSNMVISSSFVNGINDQASVNNVWITNCFSTGTSLNNSNGLFSNNICYSTLNLGSFVVRNNIIVSSGCPGTGGNVYEYNLFEAAGCSTPGDGNKFGVNMANVFEKWDASQSGGAIFFEPGTGVRVDNKFKLKAGGSGINAGRKSDGTQTDVGIYGGEPGDVYKLSGVPAVPAIFNVSAPSQSATTNPYTITVGVRSNN